MRKLFVLLTIIITLLAIIVILPSFKLNAFGKTFVFPEIDYSRYLGGDKPLNLSYKPGKDFGDYTSVTYKLLSTDPANAETSAIETVKIMKQRLDIMEIVEGEVRYYKNQDNYFLQIDMPGTKEEVREYLSALGNSGNIEFWKAIPEVDEDGDGQPDPVPSFSDNPMLSGLQPTAVTSEAFRGASLAVNSRYGGYTIKVQVDKNADPASILGGASSETWVAVSDNLPISLGAQIAIKDNLIYEFIPQIGDGSRQDALAVLSLFGTKPYPQSVQLESENIIKVENGNKLILTALVGIIIFIAALAYTYIISKKSFAFIKISMIIFSVFSLALFKISAFNILITESLLLSFFFSFIFTFIVFNYLIMRLEEGLGEERLNSKFKKLDELYKPFRKQMTLFLAFVLFLLAALNALHASVYRQFVNGFGFGIVVLFIMVHLFVKPILKTFYGYDFSSHFKNVTGKFKKQ